MYGRDLQSIFSHFSFQGSKWGLVRAVILPVMYYRSSEKCLTQQHRVQLMQRFLQERIKEYHKKIETLNLFGHLIRLKVHYYNIFYNVLRLHSLKWCLFR